MSSCATREREVATGRTDFLVGLFILVRAAAMAVAFWVLGRLAFWQFKRRYLIIVLTATTALALAFAFLRGGAIFAVALTVRRGSI